jgi:hypothetical protein
MRYSEMRTKLRAHGYHFYRRAKGAHELWAHESGPIILVTRSGLPDVRSQRNWLRDLKMGATGQSIGPGC